MEKNWKERMARWEKNHGITTKGRYTAYNTGKVYEWDEEERQNCYVGDLQGLTLEEWIDQYED